MRSARKRTNVLKRDLPWDSFCAKMLIYTEHMFLSAEVCMDFPGKDIFYIEEKDTGKGCVGDGAQNCAADGGYG